MQSFDAEMVIYDEVEKFRNWDDDEFDYPYEIRKNEIQSYKLTVPFSLTDYQIPNLDVRF